MSHHDIDSHVLVTNTNQKPSRVVHVMATSERSALLQAVALLANGTPNEYTLRLEKGSQTDLTLSRIAQEEERRTNTFVHHMEVVVRAVNAYAVLRQFMEDGVWVRQRNERGTLVVKKLALP